MAITHEDITELKKVFDDRYVMIEDCKDKQEAVNRKFANDDKRIDLINMVYWKQTHTLHGAAMALYIDYETAKRWQQDFILRVARRMGIFHPEKKE